MAERQMKTIKYCRSNQQLIFNGA